MIFARFYKRSEFSQGVGLGLPICKVIVERLGRTHRSKSQVGRGSGLRWCCLTRNSHIYLFSDDIYRIYIPADAILKKCSRNVMQVHIILLIFANVFRNITFYETN